MSEQNPYASPVDEAWADRVTPELDPPQTAKYQLLEEDYLAAAEYSTLNSPQIVAVNRKSRMRMLALGMALLLIGGLLMTLDALGVVFVFMGAGVSLLVVFWKSLLRQSVRKRVKQWIKQGILPLSDQVYSLTIDHNGVHFSERYVQSHIAWPKVNRIRYTEDHLFLYWQPAQPVTIPARCYLTEHSFRGFCRLAERLWEQHHTESESKPLGG